MRKIICVIILTLVFSGTASAKNWEIGPTFGFYQSSSSKPCSCSCQSFELKEATIQGYTLSYEINPKLVIRLQTDFFKGEAVSPIVPQKLPIETTSVSISGLTDLFNYKNYSLYGGLGSILMLGHSWGLIISTGVKTPLNESFQIKGEIQYVINGGFSYLLLSRSGFKAFVYLGMNF